MTWQERIDKAVKDKTFTKDDKEKIELWGTCVMSELDPRLPKKETGQPLDFYLTNDALAITTNVKNNRPDIAKTLFGSIKKREARILKEMGYEA